MFPVPRILSLLSLLWLSGIASAHGFLIPDDRQIPPLAMISHKVTATIDEQVVETTVDQTFRNHSSRAVEATYLFPVPRGASVNSFTMWIDGKETHGELLEANQAKSIYTEIVRRTRDPGLLEYIGRDSLQMRVFPIPAHGNQRVRLKFTHIAPKDAGIVEYSYPMRTDGKATRTLEEFSVQVRLKSQAPIQSVYSPTHAIRVNRKNDHEVVVDFEKQQALLDHDFHFFYSTGGDPIGMTPIVYRPISNDDGYFMLLIDPTTEASKKQRVPRDLVLVLDKSGSMSDQKMAQAKKALKNCLNSLNSRDRFGIVSFATTVDRYRDELQPATPEQLERAEKWVEDLRQSGGTAIRPALDSALELRPHEQDSRSFTVVFFTDGVPTVDETNPDKIVKAVVEKNSANTRIFTFGVGDDVNAAMLDQLAESTRAVSTYVRPSEDIELKVSSLQDKIRHPVMTNVRLSATGVRFHEIYPVQLPDLFHGGQLIVLGRFSGAGHAVIKLSGRVGEESKELIEEFHFPSRRTTNERQFVEHLWARRKVGYMLDQIRVNGEKKELVDEVIKLAKKYGIATPYTSYLVVPDGPIPVAAPGRASNLPASGLGGHDAYGLVPRPSSAGGLPALNTREIAEEIAKKTPGAGIAVGRAEAQNRQIDETLRQLKPEDRRGAYADALNKAKKDQKVLTEAEKNYKSDLNANQTGTQGVDLALSSKSLRNQSRLTQTANRLAYGRNCVEVGGVWIDELFDSKMRVVAVQSQSPAYFQLLENQPKLKEVFTLGNHVVWVAPNGDALVIDPKEGVTELSDETIARLFAK